MPACPRDKEYSPLSPATTLNENESSTKQNQLIDDLTKLVEKYQLDPQLVDQQPKQTELLLSVTCFVLATEAISNEDRRNLLRTIISTGTDLLRENEQIDTPSPVSIPISSMDNDDDEGDFSLDDLAKEFTQGGPSPADKVTPPNEIDELKATTKADSAISVVLSAIVLPPPPSQSPLDSILFSNCLSSQAAADEADSIWKDTSSPFGQIFCTKTADTELKATQRSSSCLLDRSLYERLSRLIDLLPKQCPINSAPSISMRPAKGPSFSSNNNVRPAREHRPNPNRPNFRAEFQPSTPMEHPRQRHPRPPAAGGFQTFNNSNYPTNYFQEPQGYRHPPPNRQPHPRAQGTHDYFYSQQDPQRNDPRPRPPNRRNHFDNQQSPNQLQQLQQQQPQQQQQQQQQQGRRGPRNNNNNNGPKFSNNKSGQNRPAAPK